MAKHYRELIAWQKAMEMVTNVYRLTQGFPKEESYGLTNQLRRCAVSIPSNIAEGQGRGEGKDFCHFLRIAHGSKQEMETQLLIAHQLGFLNEENLGQVMAKSEEFGRILSGLIKSIATTNHQPPTTN